MLPPCSTFRVWRFKMATTNEEDLTAAETQLRRASRARTQPSSAKSTILVGNRDKALAVAERLFALVRVLRSGAPSVAAREISANLLVMVQPLAEVAAASNGVAQLLDLEAQEAVQAQSPAMTTPEPREGSCSFCGRPSSEVSLASSPSAFICGTCALNACSVLGVDPLQ